MNNKYVTLIIFFFSFHETHTYKKLAIHIYVKFFLDYQRYLGIITITITITILGQLQQYSTVLYTHI